MNSTVEPKFHGAERRKIEDDRRWERTKVYLSVAGQGAIALAGLWISISLERFKDTQQAETKRIEYRAGFYASVKDDLNLNYAFACRVGDYSTTSPVAVAAKKRRLDQQFAENIPLLSLETIKAYHVLMRLITQGSGVEGKHFAFKGLITKYRAAYDNRKKEYDDRKNFKENAPPDVTNEELADWLTNTTHDSEGIRLAYADLLASFGRDSGFASLDARSVAQQLACYAD